MQYSDRMRILPIVLLLTGCGFGSGGLLGDDDVAIDDDDVTPLDDDDVVDDDDDIDDDDVVAPGLLLNELMPDNETSNIDDRGFAVDWLEIVNPTGEDVDVTGWSLSDDWTVPALSPLPALTVPAGGHLLLWADSSPDAGDRHLSFGLSEDGESVGLFTPDGTNVDWVEYPALDTDVAWSRVPDANGNWRRTDRGTPGAENGDRVPATLSLIPRGATWRYQDGDVDLGTAWRDTDHDDSAWPTGGAPLGYGDTVVTEISFGGDGSNKAATAYFRYTFESSTSGDDPLAELNAELRKDDGAIVYVNGVEVLRRGLPDGEVTADTFANVTASGASETEYSPAELPSELIVEGTNVIAIEVHQANSTSSDLNMDFSLTLTTWVVVE
jgi:hypothetical protein